jgi:hypothetical protein
LVVYIEGGIRLRVLENRVLRRIFGTKRDEVIGDWRKLHNEERNDLYSSPNVIWMIKSRRMRSAGHVAGMRRGEVYTGYWFVNLRKETTLKIQAWMG